MSQTIEDRANEAAEACYRAGLLSKTDNVEKRMAKIIRSAIEEAVGVVRSAVEEAVGVCETTSTPRKACALDCGTYVGNLGPCGTWEKGANGRCAYCDHGEDCHGGEALLDHLRSEIRVFQRLQMRSP